MYSQAELAVSILWAFREFATLKVSLLLPLHGEFSADPTNISQQAHPVSLKIFAVFYFSQCQISNTFKSNLQKAHSNLIVWIFLWDPCETTPCPQMRPPWHNSGELSASKILTRTQWWALTLWFVDPLLTKLTFLLTSWSVILLPISYNFRFLWSSPFSLYFR